MEEELGGNDPADWEEDKDKHYSEKGGHAMRGLFHRRAHTRFWKKFERKGGDADSDIQRAMNGED